MPNTFTVDFTINGSEPELKFPQPYGQLTQIFGFYCLDYYITWLAATAIAHIKNSSA